MDPIGDRHREARPKLVLETSPTRRPSRRPSFSLRPRSGGISGKWGTQNGVLAWCEARKATTYWRVRGLWQPSVLLQAASSENWRSHGTRCAAKQRCDQLSGEQSKGRCLRRGRNSWPQQEKRLDLGEDPCVLFLSGGKEPRGTSELLRMALRCIEASDASLKAF